tara:strand:+ start:207 stop:1271 length:1065 start_codon:yes stop_codon:yes gene_type:complete
MDEANLDADLVREYALKTWLFKQGEMVSLMIHLGHRLDLYRAMDGAGSITAGNLAQLTGCNERWLLEWLRCNGAGGLLSTEDGRTFTLPAESAAVLARSEEPTYAAAVFSSLRSKEVVDGLVEAFRTGIGIDYDGQGEGSEHVIEAMCGPMSRSVLVPLLIPSLTGVVEKLTDGANVVDVGCGTGLALELLVDAFPASNYVGYDPSALAINTAEKRLADYENVSLVRAGGEDLPPSGDVDLVLAMDCLHDMPRPDRTMSAIRSAIDCNGTLVIKEIRSSSDWGGNLKNPVLPFMYATSVATCLASAMSEEDTLGLGTLGLFPERLEELVLEAGFTRFLKHDLEDPTNIYYEVQP